MPATYDLSTDVGKIRLLINDTDTSAAIYTDAEITYIQSISSSVAAAAIRLLRMMATGAGLLAKRTKLGRYESEDHALADIMRAIADLENDLLGGFETGNIAADDENLESFAPKWRDDDDAGEFLST